MKVLVSHDRAEVSDRIREILNGLDGVDIEVDVALDGTSTRRLLQQKRYDLLVIDLTLPHIHGRDTPSYSNVDNLLQEIFRLDDLRVPGDIIGITLDLEALGRINTSIGAHVMAVLTEDTAGTWRNQLIDKVKYVARSAKSRQESYCCNYDYDVLIVTALDKELEPYKGFFDFYADRHKTGLYSFTFKDQYDALRRGVAFSIGKSGEARAASYTQSLLAQYRPKLAIMTGICGGVRGKTELGDLVLATSAIDWDYGKWAEEAVPGAGDGGGEPSKRSVFLSRPGPVDIEGSRVEGVLRRLISSDYLAMPAFLRNVSQVSMGRISSPRFHMAPMASGSAVVASDEILSKIRGLNESIRGIDMECFGFYHSASHSYVRLPEFVCVKSVSDYSNGTKGDEYHEGCSFLSAEIGRHLIQSLWDFR